MVWYCRYRELGESRSRFSSTTSRRRVWKDSSPSSLEVPLTLSGVPGDRHAAKQVVQWRGQPVFGRIPAPSRPGENRLRQGTDRSEAQPRPRDYRRSCLSLQTLEAKGQISRSPLHGGVL